MRSVSTRGAAGPARSSTTSRGVPDPTQRHSSGIPFGTSYVTGRNRSPLPAPPANSQSVTPATSARYASALAPPRNAQRYSPPAATIARRAPPRSDSTTTGRGGPRRASRAVSATIVPLSGASSLSEVAGGSESHATPPSAPARGEGPGGWMYQSPSCRRPSGHRSTAPPGARRAKVAGSPASITSRAAATARATSAGGTAASVAASRHRLPPGSVATNALSGTRATSVKVRARNRVSQSGGDASSTTDGCGLTSSTNVRASSRGSESPDTPSIRTSSADQPAGKEARELPGKGEEGRLSSVLTTPLSGRATTRDVSRRPDKLTTRFALAPSPFPGLLPAVSPAVPFPPSPFPGLLPALPAVP